MTEQDKTPCSYADYEPCDRGVNRAQWLSHELHCTKPFLSRTPAPLPFSGMNSMPAA